MAEMVFTTLKREHKEIRGLMQKAEKDPARFAEFTTALSGHTHAEEKTLYKQLENEKQMREMILEGYEEHHVVELVVQEMQKQQAGGEQWQAKFKVMQENLEHHIEEEESDMFPAAEKVMGRSRAMEMAEEYERAEAALVGSAGRS